jgi:hypothetical protein
VTSQDAKLPLARLAALAAALLLLLATLALARGTALAHAAAPTGGPAAPAVFVEDDEDEAEEDEFDLAGDDESDDEDEVNPCASDNEAKEEACEEKLEEEEAEELMASECRLSAAEATVTAVPGQNEVRLTVRYRTVQPSSVAVELRLRGARGPLDLGVESARFGRTGTLHVTKELSEAEMERAAAAKEFTVGIHAVNSPRFCRGLFERHLTAHQGSRWTDPTATRRAKEQARRSRS